MMSTRLLACVLLAAAATGCCHFGPACGGPYGPCGGPASHGGCPHGCVGACLHQTLTCDAGCGELYVDEWLSDPPDGCDPCDDCGVYHRPGYCCGHLLGLLHKLWGIRYMPSGYGYPAGIHGVGYPGADYPFAGYPGHPLAGPVAVEGDYVLEGGATEGGVIGGGVIGGGAAAGPGAIGRGAPLGESFYEVGPGETVVPGSTRITEGPVDGEPSVAPAPQELPGPSAYKQRSGASGAPARFTSRDRQAWFDPATRWGSGVRPARYAPPSPRRRPR